MSYMRLRYIGANATTFIGVGEVEPGVEFAVSDDQAEGFLRRPDVEEAPPEPEPTPAPARPRKASKAPSDKQVDAAAAAPKEGESGAVSDDH